MAPKLGTPGLQAGEHVSERSSALAMPVGGSLASIVPRNLDDVARLAKMAVMGGILKPIHWKKRVKNDEGRWIDDEGEEDYDTVLARGSMIIMQGLEIGVPPMQALQLMAMINGRIVAHSELVPGILWAHGFDIEQWMTGAPYEDDWTAHCRIKRPNGKIVERSFSVAQAKRAGLWSPEPKLTRKGRDNSTYTVDNDSPWYRYPDRMLPARALGFCVKDGGSDAMRGMMVREEAEDIVRMREARDVTPPKETAIEPPDPDAATVPPVPSPEQTSEPVDLPANIPQFLVALNDAMELAGTDPELIAEVRDANASIVEALPNAERKAARRIMNLED